MPLSPSVRIRLLKEIVARLSNEDWPLVDLTLHQFGLPTEDAWSQDKQTYVIQMTSSATDAVLVELARHIGFELQEAIDGPKIQPPFWQKEMFRVFITHLADHRKIAADLQDCLLRYGITCFVAHNDIVPTAEWQSQIEIALATCDSLIALLHPHFHSSNWTDQEIGFVMGRGLPIFAVQLGQVPYGFIGRFQAFRGAGKAPVVLAQEIFDAYRKHKQTQSRMASTIIRLFEMSGSFEGAKARVSYLEELEIWEPSYSDRIAAAVESNGQISGSWGVPQRVEALVKKWK